MGRHRLRDHPRWKATKRSLSTLVKVGSGPTNLNTEHRGEGTQDAPSPRAWRSNLEATSAPRYRKGGVNKKLKVSKRKNRMGSKNMQGAKNTLIQFSDNLIVWLGSWLIGT